MADKGIIFSAAMVRALLDGRKTQTRRLCKGANENHLAHVVALDVPPKPGWFGDEEGEVQFNSGYATGDRLYVREAWRTWKDFDHLSPKALPPDAPIFPEEDRDNCDRHGRYRSGRFMMRHMSRLTLTVTDVRVQRVQDISEADARAEGVEHAIRYNQVADACLSAIDRFKVLWNSLHTKPGETWDDNPWVVALTFDVRKG